MSVHLLVSLAARPGSESELQQTLATLAAASRQESGCREYRVALGEHGHAFIVEQWQDEAAFEAHQQTAHFRDGVATLQQICLALDIHRIRWQD